MRSPAHTRRVMVVWLPPQAAQLGEAKPAPGEPMPEPTTPSAEDLALLRDLELLQDLELLRGWDPAEDLPIPSAEEAQ